MNKKERRYAENKRLVSNRDIEGTDDDTICPIANWPYNGRCHSEPGRAGDDDVTIATVIVRKNIEFKSEYAYHDAMQRTHGRRLKGA